VKVDLDQQLKPKRLMAINPVEICNLSSCEKRHQNVSHLLKNKCVKFIPFLNLFKISYYLSDVPHFSNRTNIF